MFDKIGSRELVRGGGNVNKIVRNVLSFFWKDRICSDIKASVHLHGVAVDDFSLEVFGETNRCDTFPDCGWS